MAGYDDRGYRRDDRGHPRDEDRGFFERAAEEVRSWFHEDDDDRGERRGDYRRRGEVDYRAYPGGGTYGSPYEAGGGPDYRRQGDYGGAGYAGREPSSFERRGARGRPGDFGSGGPGGQPGWTGTDHGYYAGMPGGPFDQGAEYGPADERGGPRGRSAFAGVTGGASGYGGSYGASDAPRRAAGGMRGRGPEGYTRRPERTVEDVCEALTDHDHIDASGIRVSCENGEVTLVGTVGSRREKRLAEDVAESCRGVRDVHNRLRVASDAAPDSGDESAASGTPASGTSAGAPAGAQARASGAAPTGGADPTGPAAPRPAAVHDGDGTSAP